MPVAFCFIPDERSLKPAAADVAKLLKFLLDDDYVDNEKVYLDIAYENGHHRPGASDMITLADAAGVLEQSDDAELRNFFVENIRGTAKIPQLFENCDQKNLALMGWLAVRVFEEPYPIIGSEVEYSIRCAFCGMQSRQQQWGCEGDLRRCPACEKAEEMYLLDFSPKVEFARFVLEITELDFTDTPPRLKPDSQFLSLLEDALGADMKPAWYEM